ncbi:MAG: dTMP kinase [Bacteroidales bacterium]|nr:dTMP kinase [Bacteroidales bacterium]MDD3521964.1 dTMP kinase [Bacteroidales bacterium]MDD4030575.1 dTMP kinase [Bacteroidales bacterium]MDD4435306.1 dTMP kinase [Bacteroidales bacterium]MDD5733067.1 dTMP kinase [Bacteroidales bacterium]
MLIVLEGLDGAGKSTQLKAMEAYFKERTRTVHFMHFPCYDTPVYGSLIARFLRGDSGPIDSVDPYLVSLLFAGNRFEMAPRIRKWLQDGEVVLLDRYVYSNIAFQCAKLKNPAEREQLRDFILKMEYEHFGIPRPDVNLFLDVPLSFVKEKLESPRQGEDRSYLQGKDDIHEASLSFQQRVRDVYLDQAVDDKSFRIISCNDQEGRMAHWKVIFERIIPYLP